jgi:hypothetical protein
MLEPSAAAHADMLTRVDELAGDAVGERAGSAAETVARLEESDLKSSRRQGRRGR